MALSKTIKVAMFLLFWWYVYLFLTFRSPASREMPQYSMVILSAPCRKLCCLKAMMITKCKTKRITSKVILHMKLSLTVISQFFHGRTLQRIVCICYFYFRRLIFQGMFFQLCGLQFHN